jgi:hypothetical protein
MVGMMVHNISRDVFPVISVATGIFLSTVFINKVEHSNSNNREEENRNPDYN